MIQERTNDGLLQLYNSAGTEGVRIRGGGASYIDSGFGFGIGTPSPTEKLDVNGLQESVQSTTSAHQQQKY